MGAQSTWPSGSDEGEYPPGNYAAEQAGHAEMPGISHGEMARLLRETRRNVLTGACVLAAITIGTALETRFAARALQPGMFRVINIGLMLGLVFCWLTAVAQQAVVCTPVLNAVSELRWRTGAPRICGPRGRPCHRLATIAKNGSGPAPTFCSARRVLPCIVSSAPTRGRTSPPPTSFCGRSSS